MGALLRLKDETESVDFIYDASTNPNVRLQDKTFKMSIPEKVEVRATDNYFAGRNLLRQEYGPREVTFQARVMGSTQLEVSQNISNIQRLLTRASTPMYLQSGSYNQANTMTEGSDTGDQGVILQIRRGYDTLGTITSELDNTSVTISGIYTLKVIQGDVVVDDNIFASADLTGGDKIQSTSLIADMTNSQTTLDVSDAIFGTNDIVYISDGLKRETIKITNNGTNITGGRRYNITRAQGSSTAIAWDTGDIVRETTGKYVKFITITLSCEPFILGASRVIAQDNSTPGFKNGPAVGNTCINRVFVSAASVPGDVDALTRIGTQINGGTGVLIGRDAGISILNCPSFPGDATLGGQNDLYVFGQILNTSNLNCKIRIVTSPVRFQFSDDGGSSYGPLTAISSAWTPYTLQSNTVTYSSAFAMFGSTSGYTNNQVQSFTNHQAYLGGLTPLDIFDNKNGLMSEGGQGIGSYFVNIPPGCRSRYKVVAQVNSGSTNEYMMTVNFVLRNGVGSVVGTTAQFYEWTGPYTTGLKLMDLGVIDLTSLSLPFMSHPYSMMQMQINIKARTFDEVIFDASTSIDVSDSYLVPCQDEYSYMQASWKSDGSGHEVYSNYDAAHPYFGEESVNIFDSSSGKTGRIVAPLDGSYGGNMITLVPNVDQTLFIVPISNSNTDWRMGSLSTGDTGKTYFAIRPRYLHLPG